MAVAIGRSAKAAAMSVHNEAGRVFLPADGGEERGRPHSFSFFATVCSLVRAGLSSDRSLRLKLCSNFTRRETQNARLPDGASMPRCDPASSLF